MKKPIKPAVWEGPVTSWLKRHEFPQETIDKFMPFLRGHIIKSNLEAMRSMVGR